MFGKFLLASFVVFEAVCTSPDARMHVCPCEPSVKLEEQGSCYSPSHPNIKKTKFTLEISGDPTLPTDIASITRFLRLIIAHPEMEADFCQQVLLEKDSNTLLQAMTRIVVGNSGFATIFPLTKEDLSAIDDVNRNDFFSLTQWVLKVVKPNIAEHIKEHVLMLDGKFVTLVNAEWGRGIYESCAGIINTQLASYEIPAVVLEGCTVETILSTTPDFFPSNADAGFKKLVSIVKIVTPYIDEAYKPELEKLKACIKTAVEKYAPQAIARAFSDYHESSILSSIKHFQSWVDLEKTL